MLQSKPLHVRKRIAIIVTGIVGIVLVGILIYFYSHPHPVKHDLESGIMNGYTTIIEKVQSLFHRK